MPRQPHSRSSCSFHRLLVVGLGGCDREVANACDYSYPLGDGDRPSGVEQVEEMRALQTQVIGWQHREAPSRSVDFHLAEFRRRQFPIVDDAVVDLLLTSGFSNRLGSKLCFELSEQRLAFPLVEPQMLPQLLDVRRLEVVDRELQFLKQADFAISDLLA